MRALQLPIHDGLRTTTRLGGLVLDEATPTVRDWTILALAGVGAAAASMFLDFNLRVPGHAILRVAIPLTAGLALVPRRGAGTIMGVVAFLAAMAFRAAGYAGDGMSLGALTSLTATGPLLDWTLRQGPGGWRLYLASGMAGLASNLLALCVRGAAKLIGWEHAAGRPFAAWLPEAAITYTLCGFAAGFAGGAIWFYGRRGSSDPGGKADKTRRLGDAGRRRRGSGETDNEPAGLTRRSSANAWKTREHRGGVFCIGRRPWG